MKNRSVKSNRLIRAAVCLALCLVLPFLTGQIPQIGQALSPMHIPVFLCGFLCGPWYALAVGLIAPPLRYLLFHMPPIFPTGLAMSFELAAYGAVCGALFLRLPKKRSSIYLALIAAMLAGRVVWGVVRAILSGASASPFTWQAFLAGAFVNAVPGIILRIVLVPVVVMALQRAGLVEQ